MRRLFSGPQAHLRDRRGHAGRAVAGGVPRRGGGSAPCGGFSVSRKRIFAIAVGTLGGLLLVASLAGAAVLHHAEAFQWAASASSRSPWARWAGCCWWRPSPGRRFCTMRRLFSEPQAHLRDRRGHAGRAAAGGVPRRGGGSAPCGGFSVGRKRIFAIAVGTLGGLLLVASLAGAAVLHHAEAFQ